MVSERWGRYGTRSLRNTAPYLSTWSIITSTPVKKLESSSGNDASGHQTCSPPAGSRCQGAADRKRHLWFRGWALERIDQIKLEAIQVWLLRASGNARPPDRIQQTAVQSASMPQSKGGHRVAAQLIESIDSVLQNVGGGPLIAFVERGNERLLFLPQPGVTELNI